MNIVRKQDENRGLRSLHDQIDNMFNDFFRGSALSGLTQTTPSLDIYSDDDKNMVVEVHAPGFEEKDIDLSLQEGVLEIKAQRQEKQEETDKKRGYMVKESSSSFYRRIVLPEYVDENKVSAELDKGVLKVTVPYAERPEPKRIKIASRTSKK
jgi:HSP20 family protein